jgi:hypothetical protein
VWLDLGTRRPSRLPLPPEGDEDLPNQPAATPSLLLSPSSPPLADVAEAWATPAAALLSSCHGGRVGPPSLSAVQLGKLWSGAPEWLWRRCRSTAARLGCRGIGGGWSLLWMFRPQMGSSKPIWAQGGLVSAAAKHPGGGAMTLRGPGWRLYGQLIAARQPELHGPI